jgi:PKD repeat protein
MMFHLYCTHIMRVSSRLLVSQAMTKELTAVAVAAVAIAIILLAANITITNAQQQQLTNQPAVIQNGTTTAFQSTEDGIRLNVPEGWVIHDVNNTGSALLEESTQGYGILAQLCPQEEQQQQQQQEVASSNVSGSNDTSSCQGSEGDIIHMVRYPDLDTRLQAANNVTTTTPATNNNNMTTIDNILSYHMQKLQEVGYSGIEIVDSTDTTVNVTNAQTDQTIAIVPAKNVEITYSTASAPNQTRTGYFILTATDATPPSLGIRKGYSIFYEGNSDTTNAETTRPSGSLAPTPLPATVRQVFDSFELVAAVVVPTVPLTAEITSSDDEEGEVAPATFEFEADVIGGTEPYTISWDLDDDGIGESNGQTLVVTFEEAGSYNVGLTVTDSSGQSASDSMEITVEEEEVEAVEEEEEEVEENNNADSNDLIDADEIIDDVFDRLGIR